MPPGRLRRRRRRGHALQGLTDGDFDLTILMAFLEGGHRGVDALLDVVVFAPAGLVIAAVEEVPRLAARGRDVVGFHRL